MSWPPGRFGSQKLATCADRENSGPFRTTRHVRQSPRKRHQCSGSRISMEHDPSVWYQGQNLANDRAKFDFLFRWPGFRQEANIPDAGCRFWHVSNCRATALRNRRRCPDRCDTVPYLQSPLDLDRSLPFLKNPEVSIASSPWLRQKRGRACRRLRQSTGNAKLGTPR